jgi:hypothetical protein
MNRIGLRCSKRGGDGEQHDHRGDVQCETAQHEIRDARGEYQHNIFEPYS